MAFVKSASTISASSCSPPRTPASKSAWRSRRRVARPTSRSSRPSACSTTAPTPASPTSSTTSSATNTIDIQTGELLGRYIAEERDTLRLVAGCASILKSRTNGSASTSAPAADQLAGLENKVDAVCRGGRRTTSDRLRGGDARNRLRLGPPSTSIRSPACRKSASGVDLRVLSDTDIREIHRVLLGHGVLFFRDELLDDDEHLALASRFGEPGLPHRRAVRRHRQRVHH